MTDQNGPTGDGDHGAERVRSRRILTGIAPRAWEHPADKAALQRSGASRSSTRS